jgi:hypothetical protein
MIRVIKNAMFEALKMLKVPSVKSCLRLSIKTKPNTVARNPEYSLRRTLLTENGMSPFL